MDVGLEPAVAQVERELLDAMEADGVDLATYVGTVDAVAERHAVGRAALHEAVRETLGDRFSVHLAPKTF